MPTPGCSHSNSTLASRARVKFGSGSSQTADYDVQIVSAGSLVAKDMVLIVDSGFHDHCNIHGCNRHCHNGYNLHVYGHLDDHDHFHFHFNATVKTGEW